jgi:hypothetical protein
MAKLKGKGVVIAGLLAGAASFLSKKENRDKAMVFLNEAKTKAAKVMTDQNQNYPTNTNRSQEERLPVGEVAGDVAEAAASPNTLTINENEFLSEGGAQRTIAEYNEQQQ